MTARPRPWAGLAAALLINALLSLNIWWPTPLPLPDHRVAPAFILLWTALLLHQRWRGAPGPRLLAGLGVLTLALALLRYTDVVVPALFGRTLNLYWDVQHLPRFLWVASAQLPPLLAGVVLLGSAALLLGLLAAAALGLRNLWAAVATGLLPRAQGSVLAWGLTGFGLLSVAGNLAGVAATWPYISKPILPTYLRQAEMLWVAASPERMARALPASPAFDGRADLLRGQDLTLLFLESYGAVVDDDPALRAAVAPGRALLAQAAAASGRQLLSARLRSPTYGGASDLAHLSLLSGIDLADPRRHDLLLRAQRPTLVHWMRDQGYLTQGIYPGLSWPWPESRAYGYEQLIDGPSLDYRGPRFGPWWIPDQYALAKLAQQHPSGPGTRPQFRVYASIISHVPFVQIPPVQADWSRLLGPQPFDPAASARALAEQADWLNLRPGYRRAMDHNLRVMAGYLAQPRGREELLILLGDHQPLAGVSGPGQPWEVPIHVLSRDPVLIERFRALGFRDGVQPQGPALGGMHDLTRMLMQVLDSRQTPGAPALPAPPPASTAPATPPPG